MSPAKATDLVRGQRPRYRRWEERLRVPDLFSLKKRRLRGDFTAVYNYLSRGYREDRARLFLKEYGNGTRSKRHKFECEEL